MNFVGFIAVNLILSFVDASSQEFIPTYHFLHNFLNINTAGDTNNQLRTNPISK